jgi:orotidine-5'-phosphate decarboxylase
MNEQIIVAVDGMSQETAIGFVAKLIGKPGLWGFKGNDLLLELGAGSSTTFLGRGGRTNVFLDPKLKDIPNTVENSVRKLAQAGADLITVHAAGGVAMMKAAVKATEGTNAKILAVTVLTHLTQDDLYDDTGEAGLTIPKLVLRRANLAVKAGVWGLVCAPSDLQFVEDIPLKKVTPNIRLNKSGEGDDQNRNRQMTPEEAIHAGSDFLVVGRDLTKAEDPVAVLASINNRVQTALDKRG